MSVEDIDWSCPADMEPYLKAHEEELKEKDYFAWLSNQYTLSAVSVAVEHCLAGRKAHSEYIKEPILKTAEKNKPLTEDEKQKEVDLFFARENARRINWKYKKNKKS